MKKFKTKRENLIYMEGVRDGQKMYWKKLESTNNSLWDMAWMLRKEIDNTVKQKGNTEL